MLFVIMSGNCKSRPAWGAWIEIFPASALLALSLSRPARGAWIEIRVIERGKFVGAVAPREGCVD